MSGKVIVREMVNEACIDVQIDGGLVEISLLHGKAKTRLATLHLEVASALLRALTEALRQGGKQ